MGKVETEIGERDNAKKVKKDNKTIKNSSFPLHPFDEKITGEQTL